MHRDSVAGSLAREAGSGPGRGRMARALTGPGWEGPTSHGSWSGMAGKTSPRKGLVFDAGDRIREI